MAHWSQNGSLSIYVHNTIPPSELLHKDRLAVFDLDGTLITTQSGKKFPQDETDWKWLYDNTKPVLKRLLKKGYHVVIITNQALKNVNKLNAVREKLVTIIGSFGKYEELLTAFVATKNDSWRKPHTRIWKEYLGSEHEKIFYVGDAAGRVKDHSCVDRKLAHNVGIKFYTPEMYFLGEEDEAFEWGSSGNVVSPRTTFSLPKMRNPHVAILIGPPASGKSSFAKQYLPNNSVVSMDLYKTKVRTMKVYKDFLEKAENIVVDNTNPSKEGRTEYVNLAKANGYHCYFFVMDVGEELAKHLDYYRVAINKGDAIPTIAYRMYYSKLELPKKYVLVPPFGGKPEFTKKQRKVFMEYSE